MGIDIHEWPQQNTLDTKYQVSILKLIFRYYFPDDMTTFVKLQVYRNHNVTTNSIYSLFIYQQNLVKNICARFIFCQKYDDLCITVHCWPVYHYLYHSKYPQHIHPNCFTDNSNF